jgi:serine/threonine protein kinase
MHRRAVVWALAVSRRDRRHGTENPLMGSSEVHTARLPEEGGVSGRRSVQAPLVLDRYRLHRRLGAGAFGTVWMARDERLERDVAVKLLARERVVGGRFEREARAAARLSHPGIVTLYEAAVDDEGAYLVSELVLGSTLDTLLVEGRLSDLDIVEIGVVLCDALEHAHAQGVVHRDVKPSNVLVPEAPAGVGRDRIVAKLTDFGVARVIGVGGESVLTHPGDVLGTLAYMAPEQAEGQEVGGAADLYSLALVIYESLTGVNPVKATTAFQRARRLGAHLPPLRRQRRDLPSGLGLAIDAALRPRPRDRGTLADLRGALRAARARVGDEPGIVTSAWTRDDDELGDGGAPGDRGDRGDEAPFSRRSRADPDPEPDTPEDELQATERRLWIERGTAGVAAGGYAAWAVQQLIAPSPVPPAGAAVAAAVAVLCLPRLGWLALSVALVAGAGAQGHSGGALVLAIAAVLPMALLALRPGSWPLAALAPALGLIGLAGAWPAVAGRGGGAVQRAALGAIGWIWLLLAGALLGGGHVLYLPHIPGVPAPHVWTDSLPSTTGRMLRALGTSGALAPAAVWALASLTAPWVVRGRTIVLDLVRVVIWSSLTAGGTSAAVVAVHGSDAIGSAPSALLGATAGAVIALAPRTRSQWHRARYLISDAGARLP